MQGIAEPVISNSDRIPLCKAYSVQQGLSSTSAGTGWMSFTQESFVDNLQGGAEETREPVSTAVYRVTATIMPDQHNGPAASEHSRSPSLSPSCDSNEGPVGNITDSQQAVRHWTYEEQFRQLYNLSPDVERKEFLDKLFEFMQKKGTPITRIPIMAKQPLDLCKLFKLVVERGGLVEVIKKKAWRDIAKELNLPASITSAAFTMRSQYVKYLYPYECEVEHLSDPQELQLAIDSNKRDRRQSETVNEFIAVQSGDTPREQILASQATAAYVTPAGLQLIGSPTTVAIPQGSIPPYSGSFIIAPSGQAQMVHPPHLSGPHLLQMQHQPLPIMVPTSLQGPTQHLATMIPVKAHEAVSPVLLEQKPVENERELEGGVTEQDLQPPQLKKRALDSGAALSMPTSHPSIGARMPYTNISIKPGKEDPSSSVLVTLELNGLVYQGVLFARPNPSGSSPPPR